MYKFLINIINWFIRRFYFFGLSDRPGYVKACRFLAYTAAAILVTDLHKYGSWYMGNSTYWQPWAYIVMPLLLLPGVLYVIALWTVWKISQGKVRLVQAIYGAALCYICLICLLFDRLTVKQFPDPGYFGGLTGSGEKFWITILFVLYASWAMFGYIYIDEAHND